MRRILTTTRGDHRRLSEDLPANSKPASDPDPATGNGLLLRRRDSANTSGTHQELQPHTSAWAAMICWLQKGYGSASRCAGDLRDQDRSVETDMSSRTDRKSGRLDK
jgi:hypothetical protein